jgi:hypothetical protein
MIASQADTVSGVPAVISAEEDLADLVLSLIFRKRQLLERFPRIQPVVVKTISNFSRRHLISSTVVSALPNSDLPPETIAALTESMSKRGEDQKALHRQLGFAIADMQPALDQEGISWRVIKGPRLQHDYYGTLTREYFDLDVLVPKDQFMRARRVLARLGWRPHKRGFIPLTFVRAFEHGLGLKRGEAIVDLHWSIRVRPAYRIDENRVFAAARTFCYAGVNVPVLDSEYDLTICLLSIAHGIEREKVLLRDAIDLYSILRSVDATISWESFFRERQREGTKRICVSLLAQAVSWLDEQNALPHLRCELAKMGPLGSLTDVNHLKNCIFAKNAKGAGWRWYLSVYHGGKGRYWLHRSMSVILNQEFPYNLHRTSLFRRFMR